MIRITVYANPMLGDEVKAVLRLFYAIALDADAIKLCQETYSLEMTFKEANNKTSALLATAHSDNRIERVKLDRI